MELDVTALEMLPGDETVGLDDCLISCGKTCLFTTDPS
jgi:hypothetical protein